MTETIETLLEQIENGENLNDTDLIKYTDDLLNRELSRDACRIFLALANNKVILSEEIYNRICNVIINNHGQSAKENAIRIIDILIENNQNVSNLCLDAVETALKEEQSQLLKRYAVQILISIIEKSININFKHSLLNSLSNVLQDNSTNYQTKIITFFEILIRKQPQINISQEILENIKTYLSKISPNMDKNYYDCSLISSFIFQFLKQRHKIDADLLETFSQMLIFPNTVDQNFRVNLAASFIIHRAIENQLFDGDLSSNFCNNISICFNSKAFDNEQLFSYCLKILYVLNDEQLKLTKLNGNLLEIYLNDSNLKENQSIQLTILFGKLCRLSYKYVDDKTNESIIDSIIDIFIQRLDQEKFVQSSIFTLKIIGEYQRSYLSKYPLQKFVNILNQNELHKEIRQNSCLILQFAAQTEQVFTNYEIDALENALNDSDSTLSLIALQTFQDLIKKYHENIEPYIDKLCTFITDLISHSNEVFTLNASNLLEIILKSNFNHQFSSGEIENLCFGLQRNVNPSIRQSISNSLQNIVSKQIDIPTYTRDLLKLEALTEEFLQNEHADSVWKMFEKTLIQHFHEKTFDKKIVPINLLEAINRILKMGSDKLIPVLVNCAENNLQFSNDLIKTLFEHFQKTRSEISIKILYIVFVQNGQTFNTEELQSFLLNDDLSSIYMIEILKFLINRNQIEINLKIYEKLINLLQNSNDSNMQSLLLETITYTLENSTSSNFPLKGTLKLIESYFQSASSSKQIKYYSCLVLNAFVKRKIQLSQSTIDSLKRIYAGDDDDELELTVELRDIIFNILKQYLSKDEIDDFTNEEKLLDYGNPSARFEMVSKLLSRQYRLSKYQLRLIELSLNFPNSSIDYKLIVLKIFQNQLTDLNSTQIELIFKFIKEKQLNTIVVEICKSLIDMKRSFSDEILRQLIDVVFESDEQSLRNSVIDCLKAILKNHRSMSKDLSNQIQLEIDLKDLRESKSNFETKKKTIEHCLQSTRELSLNGIDSLEYFLANPSEMKDIEKEVLDLIELAINHHQQLSSNFVNHLSRLMKNSQFDRSRLISILNHLSIHFKQQITQETFDNTQEYLVENFDQSLPILLQATQNGCELNSNTMNSLKTSHYQDENFLKILQNQVKYKPILDSDLIQHLENHFERNPQLVLNILKYIPTYEPSQTMKENIYKFLVQHRFFFHFEIIFNQIVDLPIQARLHFIEICLRMKHSQLNIVAMYPLELLCRQLLCNNLLETIAEKNKYEKFDELEFYSNLNHFEEHFLFKSFSVERDEILIQLTEQYSTIFTLKQINQILFLLKTNPEALQIFSNSSSTDCLKNLQIHWIYYIIDQYSYIKHDENIHLKNEQAEQILDLLLSKLGFNLSMSEHFLRRIYRIEKFDELIAFLRYLVEKNVSKELNLNDYFTGELVAKDLFSWTLDIQSDLIEKRFRDVCQQRKFNDLKRFQNLRSIVLEMRLNNWSFEIFERLIEILKTKHDQSFEIMIDNFINSLKVIQNFSISNQYQSKIESIFKSTRSQDWTKEIQKFAVSVSFDKNEKEKDLTELINEIRSNGLSDKQNIDLIEDKYRQLSSAYDSDSEFHSIGKAIKTWNEDEITQWTSQYKSNQKDKTDRTKIELICVIKRAIYLHNPKQKFEPRTIQILSLLLLLDASEKEIARLAQIKTGEGKSVIIAMFAAIQALNGRQVDVVTTSPLLAKRDADNKKTFYKMLSLTVGENSGTSNVKSCYKCDIVYGNVNEYQFDILKDEYSLLGTRCGRKFDVAIVDEVDSMFIDENSKVCRLSNKIPAIDELKIILTLIWQELNRTYERIVRIENKLYCILVPFRFDENGQIILIKGVEADDDGKVLETSATVSDDNQENFVEINDPYEFIEKHIRNYVENKLLDSEKALVHIPKHLMSFVQQQLPKWIFNAWQAKFAYRENIDYLISDEKNGKKAIVPIDYRNTGIIQTNTSWPDGLHQFLQIKHRLRISAENLTTNFLSNVAYFSRYGKNLFGLTGTFGSQEAKDLIHHIYNVDFVIIPPYKYTQFVLYSDQFCQSEDDWLDECTRSIVIESKVYQRAVLVICETKSNATKIYEKLIEKDHELKKKIKLYTRSDNEEQNAIENELDCGEIIVATNLAGRGTDIGTTRPVEDNGGLHVLVTFLPLNTRVEQQAFGRTSRQGKRGTAQLIVYDTENQYHHMEKLKEDRNLREKLLIERAKHVDLKNILRRDKLFQKFCDLRKNLRQQENDTYKLDSVEEQWGLWLKTTFSKEDSMTTNQTTELTDEILEGKFSEFSKQITTDYSSNKIFQNPFYLILKANYHLYEKKNYDQAIELLKVAIDSDSTFAVSARYNLAYALIKKSTKNKNEAKTQLEEALKTLDDIFINQYQVMLISFDTNPNKTDGKVQNDAEEQIMNRINLLYLCQSLIEQGIGVIKETEENDKKLCLEYKVLDEFFSEINKPTLDINEFKESGFVGFFQLTAKEPTPWMNIITVGIIGLAQAAAGAALIVFSCGAAATLGNMLLSEGINDMIFAIKCGITGEFSWEEYKIQKAISLTITIATCGLGALKEAGQLMKSGFKGCASLVKATTIGGQQAIGLFTKAGWNLVGKQIVNSFVKAGAKEVLKTVLDKTVLAELSKQINEEITKNIESKVNDKVQQNQLINQFLSVNIALQKPNVYYQQVDRIVYRILHPQSNRFVEASITIAKGILNHYTNGVTGRTIQIFAAGKCLAELVTFLEKFFKEFNQDLEKSKNELKIDHVLQTNTTSTDVDIRTFKDIAESLRRQQYIDKHHIQVLKPLEQPTFKLPQYETHEIYVMNVCNSIYTETTKDLEYTFEKNIITKNITSHLVNYMTNRINATLINPVVHAGVDATVNHLADKIERACADSRGTLQEQITNRRAQNTIIKQGNLLPKSTDKNQTRDENIHPAVENLACNVENDGPGDLKDMIAISAKLGRPIKIYRDGKYDLTIGDTNNGEPLEVDFSEGQSGDIGHYTSVKGENNVRTTGPTNCLFDTLSAQTNMSSNELRQIAAAGIRENPDAYLKMMPSINLLQQNSDKSLLYAGGDNARARKHSVDAILNDSKLSSREKLKEGLEKVLAGMKEYSSDDREKIILETIIHDITNTDIQEVIADDPKMRNMFYDSLNRRLDHFREMCGDALEKSDTMRTEFNNVASYWRENTYPPDTRNPLYSQANVNANFSKCERPEAERFLPKPVREMIASQPIEPAGINAIKKYGPAICPIQVFSYQDKLVAINNRMTLAHELAGQTPLRLIPVIPKKAELGRMKKPGMPSDERPKYDKNIPRKV